VYDALHAPGTVGEAKVVVKLGRALTGIRRGPLRVLEPACGTGRHLIALGRLGHSGVGVDLSASMVRFAVAEAKRAGVGARAKFVCADMARLTLPAGSVDVAFCLINSIRHLLSEGAMVRHLRCVRRGLSAGGVYLVGIETIVEEAEGLFASEDVWTGHKHGLRVKQVVQYVPPTEPLGRDAARRESVISTMLVRRSDGAGRAEPEQQIDSAYWLRTYTQRQWREVIAKAGMEEIGVYNASGVARPGMTVGYYIRALRARA
jgi:SAM-dependent methyltransferase